jgi:uncharacterized protein (TIGR02118 family)
MNVLRVGYKSGVRFDHAYYKSKHLPLAGSIMGPHGVTNVEVATFAPGPDGAAPPYQVMFSAYFSSAGALQAALADPRIADVMADVPNYFDGQPDVWLGEVTAPVN